MISLYTDENVDARILDGLRRRGLDAETAREAGMTGPVDDGLHLEHALRQERVLLTGDEDLLGVATRWTQAGRSHAA